MKEVEPLSEKAKTALAERDKLHRHYRKAKAAEWRQLCSERPYGPRLEEFAKRLDAFTSVTEHEQFLAYIYEAAEARWLRAAPDHIRIAAMSRAARQITKIRVAAGLAPFDDPLPTSDDDVFQILRQVMGGAI